MDCQCSPPPTLPVNRRIDTTENITFIRTTCVNITTVNIQLLLMPAFKRMWKGYVFTGVCLSTGGGGYPWSLVLTQGGYPWSLVLSGRGGRYPSQACSWGEGYLSLVLGQGYHGPPDKTRTGVSSARQDHDRSTPPPPPRRTTTEVLPSSLPGDRLRRERYASCGHTGGLSCLKTVNTYPIR